ncbi:transposase [Escherichia coli]|nr:transposase [Escherichia coli]EFN9733993.1 transposase [Escherichia coli]EFN9743691.1 transposase [Escherichia coli]EFO0662268.1 transposase [Escherichia coli]
MSIYIDGRDCCQTGQFSQDVADGALTKRSPSGDLVLWDHLISTILLSYKPCFQPGRW